MIFLYTLVLLLLGAAKFLIGRRVARLEKQYIQAADEADKLLKQAALKEGNSGRTDPAQLAKRQYLLGVIVQRRDRIEDKHDAWTRHDEKFGRFVSQVRAWKGRKLPYTFGVLDVSMVLVALDYLGLGEAVNARHLVQVVTSLFAG